MGDGRRVLWKLKLALWKQNVVVIKYTRPMLTIVTTSRMTRAARRTVSPQVVVFITRGHGSEHTATGFHVWADGLTQQLLLLEPVEAAGARRARALLATGPRSTEQSTAEHRARMDRAQEQGQY